MARSFAKGSGGALAIASEPGQGTKVSVWLPVTDRETNDRHGSRANGTGAFACWGRPASSRTLGG